MELEIGKKIYSLAGKMFPICRSITGAGVRETLSILSEYISDGADVEVVLHEVPTGTKVFDWQVPKEWVAREAFIEDAGHRRVVDFKNNNLHVMGYSISVDQWVSLDELKRHIHTLPGQPEWIPYVTSYYKEDFAFCMSEKQKNSLEQGMYRMYIDSGLFDGSLTYGEVVVPGRSGREIFFSTYICHPSMANDNCSGPALAAELIRYVAAQKVQLRNVNG